MQVFQVKGNMIQESIEKLIGAGGIYRVFDVLPLDSRVEDVQTAKFYLSRNKLLFVYDSTIEVYDLNMCTFTFNDVTCSFDIQAILLEGNFDLSQRLSNVVLSIKDTQNRLIFSIQEGEGLPKDFILRDQLKLDYNFRTWAMGQLIINLQKGVENKAVEDMLGGFFTGISRKNILRFMVAFFVYLGLKIITVNFLPGILNTVLDTLFVLVLFISIYIMYKTLLSTLDRFRQVYLSYRS